MYKKKPLGYCLKDNPKSYKIKNKCNFVQPKNIDHLSFITIFFDSHY